MTCAPRSLHLPPHSFPTRRSSVLSARLDDLRVSRRDVRATRTNTSGSGAPASPGSYITGMRRPSVWIMQQALAVALSQINAPRPDRITAHEFVEIGRAHV